MCGYLQHSAEMSLIGSLLFSKKNAGSSSLPAFKVSIGNPIERRRRTVDLFQRTKLLAECLQMVFMHRHLIRKAARMS